MNSYRIDNGVASFQALQAVRLLTVSHFFESHGGGIERVAAQLCRQFARDGHQPVWAASDSDPPPNYAIEPVRLCCANPTEASLGLPMPIPGAGAIRDLSRAIRDADAIIVHDALYLTSILAMVLAKFRRKPVVLIQHIADIDFASSAMRFLIRVANRLVTRPMLYAADELVFISDHVRRDLLGERPARTFRLLHNGVDSAIFHTRDASVRSAVRSAFGIPLDVRLVLFVGRFVSKKGMLVLEALAHQRPDLQFALAGSGPVRPEQWGLSNVHVLGSQPQERLGELYCAADLLLLPSVGEGYPLVIQEAMACSLPVVCGEESACADPVATQWLRGVRIDLADPERSALRCSAAIDSLSGRPIDCAAMTSYAARAYSWPTMARAIVQSLSARAELIRPAAGGYQPG